MAKKKSATMPSASPAALEAAPLVALSALGLGPLAGSGGGARGPRARWLAIDSAGTIGRQLVLLALGFGGRLEAEQLRFQTSGSDPALLDVELRRLADADLVTLEADGTVRLLPDVQASLGQPGRSLADPQGVTNDELGMICRRLGLGMPRRKQERVDAIAAHLADPESGRLALKELSPAAHELLDRIVDAGGLFPVPGGRVGLDYLDFYTVHSTHGLAARPRRLGPIRALEELAGLGLVGVGQWDQQVWLWQEAIPVLDRQFYRRWHVAPQPPMVPAPEPAPQVPPFVSTTDRALAHWAQSPPAKLKTDDPRLGKAVVTSTAKAVGAPPAAVDLAARLIIDIGLLEPTATSASGRGRNRRVDYAWMTVPERQAAWNALGPVPRWARLVAAWCRPTETHHQQQLLWNRHLVLWELSRLAPGTGYGGGDEPFALWIEDRYGTLAVAEAVHETLADLRTLGMVAADGPLALTGPTRRLLADPATAAEAFGPASRSVVVQGDLTVLVPPDIDPAIEHRLAALATVESSGGARVLRLEESRITRAVQAGDTADGIVGFLREVSSVPLVDAVTRLVADAAARAQRVSLLPAATVVIVADPADLTLACSVKAAKLQPVASTVAVSPLPLDKVRAALDRKGLAPVLAAGSEPAAGRPGPQPGGDQAEAARLRDHAQELRRVAERFGHDHLNGQAKRLLERAELLANPHQRLTVAGPLALTPETLTPRPSP